MKFIKFWDGFYLIRGLASAVIAALIDYPFEGLVRYELRVFFAWFILRLFLVRVIVRN